MANEKQSWMKRIAAGLVAVSMMAMTAGCGGGEKAPAGGSGNTGAEATATNSGFVLTDMSSFGTWVRFDGSDSPVRLRRDACILHGTGQIALAVPFTDSSAPVMNFEVPGTSVHLG